MHWRKLWATAGLALGGAAAAVAAEPSAESVEFFEKRVRPILVEHCQKCHGAEKQKGGLRLDSRDALMQGGDSGPAVVTGEPAKSLLIEAVSYDPDGYQMPPTGKLSDDAIAALTEWVKQGAPWPGSAGGSRIPSQLTAAELAERAQHWSFQPVRAVPPSAVERADWPRNPIDAFILQAQEQAGLAPSAPADRRALLRRVTLELTGLPPTPEEIESFLGDAAPDAYDRLVERLLASPHYGERWARHWLDLVRYAETSGHEFDYEILHATPYRDYVIRAFNADLPYDQFVIEQLAGDLLREPRRDPATHRNESAIGTASYWFGQGKHSPVDLRAEECDTVDNQLDVIGKTFLGLTIACARCHDHKFDPLTQRDYYAQAGFLQSSRQAYLDVNHPAETVAAVEELTARARQARPQLLQTTLANLQPLVERLPALLAGDPAHVPGVPADVVTNWRKAQHDEALNDRGHPLHLWAHWSDAPADQVARRVKEWRRTANRDGRKAESFYAPRIPAPEVTWTEEGEPVSPWFYEGFAFAPQRGGGRRWLLGDDPARPLRGIVSPATWAHSGAVSTRLRGTLRSPTFTISAKYVDYWMHRRGGDAQPHRPNKVGQVSLIIDGFQFIRNPLYGNLTLNVAQRDTPQWYRQDVSKFVGSRAYIEIEDLDDGEIVVERIEFRDDAPPPPPYNALVARQLAAAPIDDLPDVARLYQAVCETALEGLRREEVYGAAAFARDEAAAGAELVNWLLRQPAQLGGTEPPQSSAADFVALKRELEARIPTPQLTLAMTDGTAENEHVLIRGNPRKPGEEVPRRFLDVLAADRHAAAAHPESGQPGSGRLEWAHQVASPTNPLTPRVIVNRLWQHHFGRGLVPTPDDFGKMGQPPSHPELLDWLAAELVHSGWSLKHLHRLMLTSQTYQMTSRPSAGRAEEVDPQNRLLHRMPVQRLEAEAVRDSLLALSGRLDDRMYGPSVLPYLTPFMEGRGRPGQSGPLDGAGRRSLYINVRRNFLPPMFLAFDFPTPFTTMGRRSTSNVPAQALTMMNNPFVVQQAEQWARRVTESTADPAERVTRFYVAAFGRPPEAAETAAALDFVAQQAAEYGAPADPRAWNDLAHVLLNVKEFLFIE